MELRDRIGHQRAFWAACRGWTGGIFPVWAALCLSAPSASAAQLGVYLDAEARTNSAQVFPVQPFEWYVIADRVDAELKGYEFRLQIDPEINVTGRVAMPSDTSLDLGAGEDNWIVGTGRCFAAFGPTVLVAYSAVLLQSADNLRIEILPAEPADPFHPFTANYAICGADETYAFDSLSGAILNAEQQSWGAVKDLYRQ